MRLLSDIAAGLACLSAALTIIYYVSKRKGFTGHAWNVGTVAVVGFLAFGGSSLVGIAIVLLPDQHWLGGLQMVVNGVALAASLVIWVFLPRLLAELSPAELLEANKALSGTASRRTEEVARLAASKADLEQAFAERTHALDEANQRFATALKNSDISMSQQDRDLRYVWVYNMPNGLPAEKLIGRLQSDVLPGEAEAIIAAAKRGVIAKKSAVSLDVNIPLEGSTRSFHQRIEPLWREGGVTGVLTTAIETTSYRLQQEELRSLLRELTHRTKNLLAVIMGIARQSGRSSTDVATFVARFNGRIRTLALTHELLVDSGWRGVELKALIAGVWRTSCPEVADRFTLDGDRRFLAPDSAQNLALAIYELQTNAIDHGGLLGPSGAVKVHWAPCKEDDPDQGVELIWEETGARSASAKHGDDFGESFVHVLLPRATKGRSIMQLNDRGLTWSLTLPSANFVRRSADHKSAEPNVRS
jgi:two-component sensor histidine kinase